MSRHHSSPLKGLLVLIGVLASLPVVALALIQVLQLAAVALHTPYTEAGVVVDQDGKGVQGVRLDYEVSAHFVAVPLPFVEPLWTMRRWYTATTDSQGRYVMKSRLSQPTALSIEKPGYVLDFIRGNPYCGSRDHNYTLYNVSNQNTQQVRKVEIKSAYLPADGKPVFINLRTGTVTDNATNADLCLSAVELARAASVRPGTPYWQKIRVLAVRGGVIVAENDKPFAPETGYEDGFCMFRGWGDSRSKMPETVTWRFFYRKEDGSLYARVQLTLFCGRQETSLKALVNNSGSRFLHATQLWEQGGDSLSPRVVYPDYGPWWKQVNDVYLLTDDDHYTELYRRYRRNLRPLTPALLSKGDIRLLDTSNSEVNVASLIMLLDNPTCPANVIREAFRDGAFTFFIARNPATPRDILEQLAANPEPGKRKGDRQPSDEAAKNLQIPNSMRRFLTGR